MKIKCPACSKVLNIPEAAAGKVVKCPCGKQLRAPAGAGGSPAAAAGAAAKRPAKPAAGRTSPARPPTRPTGSAGDFDASMLDELTDQDLQPVRSAGQSAAPQATGSGKKKKKKKKDALASASVELEKERSKTKSEFRKGAAKEVYSSIGILLLLGSLRLGFSIYFLMGAEAEVDALGLDAGVEGDMDLLLTLVKAVYIINIVIGALFLTCAALIFKFPMTCAFTALVTFVIAEIIGLILNPLALFSFGGWVARCAIFGGLVQTVNNASYYKFVKSGGRDGG